MKNNVGLTTPPANLVLS